MSNDPKSDLIYAILSLDSYNRGYGRGITGLSDAKDTGIGSWTVDKNASGVFGSSAFTAGFYAIAYRNGTDTVISYRGTDTNTNSATQGGSDALNGYGIALGATQGNSFNVATRQAELAADFYQAVTGNTDAQRAEGTVLTGHSLGGGLAGYIGLTSGTRSVLFDHLPFDVSGVVRAGQLGVTPQFNSVTGYFTQGEFLQAARAGNLQTVAGGIIGGLAGLIPLIGPEAAVIIAAYGGSLGGATAALEANIEKTPLDSNYESLSPLSPFNFYHSASLLTSLLWNEAYGNKTWVPAAQELWGAYFDDAVAVSLPGLTGRKTSDGNDVATLQSAIAYSALDIGKGELPFGDTGIWSLFNDAGDLGTVLAGDEASSFGTQIGGLIFGRKDIKQYLADLTVQYAGALALYDVEQDDGGTINTAAGAVDARQGVLRRTDDVLALDVSSYLWSDVLKSNADAVTTLAADRLDPLNLATFRTAFFDQNDKALLAFFSGVLGIAATPEALAAAGWGASSADIFDRFHIAATDGASNITLSDRSYTAPLARGESAHVDVYVGSSANDNECITVWGAAA